jgi:hypothetical protein
MKNLIEALKNIAWDAVSAHGHQTEASTKADQIIADIEAEEALFERKYAIYAKRISSLNSHKHWQVIETVDSMVEAHNYMCQTDEKTFCQEILVAKKQS